MCNQLALHEIKNFRQASIIPCFPEKSEKFAENKVFCWVLAKCNPQVLPSVGLRILPENSSRGKFLSPLNSV